MEGEAAAVWSNLPSSPPVYPRVGANDWKGDDTWGQTAAATKQNFSDASDITYSGLFFTLTGRAPNKVCICALS